MQNIEIVNIKTKKNIFLQNACKCQLRNPRKMPTTRTFNGGPVVKLKVELRMTLT